MIISPDKLARLDLNLLPSLQVLIEERNVSRAADRLFITQPAMSRTLARLRNLFDDELFIRTPKGLVPTPRCLELKNELPQLIDNIGGFVSSNDFTPVSFHGTFKVSVIEKYGESLFSPLMKLIQKEAPNLIVKAVAPVDDTLTSLIDGSIDFAIDSKGGNSPDLTFHALASNEPVIIVRKNHPLTKIKKIKVEDIIAFKHVRCFPVDVKGFAPDFECMLESLGLSRSCFFETEHLLTALQVVINTDGVLAAPAFIFNNNQFDTKLTIIQLPKEFKKLTKPIGISQHKRTINSPSHHWFLEKIELIAKDCWW